MTLEKIMMVFILKRKEDSGNRNQYAKKEKKGVWSE